MKARTLKKYVKLIVQNSLDFQLGSFFAYVELIVCVTLRIPVERSQEMISFI